jgi:cell division protein WhiA
LPLGDDARPGPSWRAGAVRGRAGARRGRPRPWLDGRDVSGATARRAFALVQHRYGVAPELRVRAPGGVQRRRLYGVRSTTPAEHRRATSGSSTATGARAGPPVPPRTAGAACAARSSPAGSISSPGPGAAPRGGGAPSRRGVWLRGPRGDPDRRPPRRRRGRYRGRRGRAGPGRGQVRRHHRGPPRRRRRDNAFLRWDERRLRRQLRRAATRLANADAANLRRTVEAASSQVAAGRAGRRRARLGRARRRPAGGRHRAPRQPQASLAELGQLADPPLSKTAVHRRLRRLERSRELRGRVRAPPRVTGRPVPGRTGRRARC